MNFVFYGDAGAQSEQDTRLHIKNDGAGHKTAS